MELQISNSAGTSKVSIAKTTDVAGMSKGYSYGHGSMETFERQQCQLLKNLGNSPHREQYVSDASEVSTISLART